MKKLGVGASKMETLQLSVTTFNGKPKVQRVKLRLDCSVNYLCKRKHCDRSEQLKVFLKHIYILLFQLKSEDLAQDASLLVGAGDNYGRDDSALLIRIRHL